jgi:ribosomal subunit interface protein
MYVPLELSFRNVEKSPELEDLIQKKTEKLEKVCDHISSCRVSVEKPQEHMSSGNPYRVRIDLTVPPSHELVAKQEPGQGDQHHELNTVIRKVFQKAERQLKKLMEKQSGRVKTHESQQPVAIVSQLFRDEGYGFLKAVDDDREVYFHQNAVHDNQFERLQVGTGVFYEMELGNKGPQATTVRIVDKPGAGRAEEETSEE